MGEQRQSVQTFEPAMADMRWQLVLAFGIDDEAPMSSSDRSAAADSSFDVLP